MNNEEINMAMAKIAGKCWHEADDGSMYGEICSKCGYDTTDMESRSFMMVEDCRLDYVRDLNLVREVELKLVEEGLYPLYYDTLCGSPILEDAEYGTTLADAKTRCLAIIKTKEDRTK